jgi:hypothetical protein
MFGGRAGQILQPDLCDDAIMRRQTLWIAGVAL